MFINSDLRENNSEPITEAQWREFDETADKDYYGKSKTLAEKAAWEFIGRLPGITPINSKSRPGKVHINKQIWLS